MKKNLALKIKSQEEADFCGQILEKIGVHPVDYLYFNFGENKNYLFTKNGDYFFAYKQVVDNAIKRGDITLVNSWREFVLSYLGDYYYLCRNKEEKIQLQNLFFETDLADRQKFPYGLGKMDYPYIEMKDGVAKFYNEDGRDYHKQEITLDNLILLINSVGQFKKLTMKTKNKTNKTIKNTVLHLKDKKEKAAAKVYLDGFFNDNELCVNFCSFSFMLDRSDCIYFKYNEVDRMISSWRYGHKPDKFTNTLGFAELEEFAQLIREEKMGERERKVFTFQNGLVAKYNANNDGNIIIGCKEKDLEFWRKFTNQIIELNESFKISSYSFTISEIIGFKKWLENL